MSPRSILDILKDIKRNNKDYEVADDLIIEALESLAANSHKPVKIADVVKEVLNEKVPA